MHFEPAMRTKKRREQADRPSPGDQQPPGLPQRPLSDALDVLPRLARTLAGSSRTAVRPSFGSTFTTASALKNSAANPSEALMPPSV